MRLRLFSQPDTRMALWIIVINVAVSLMLWIYIPVARLGKLDPSSFLSFLSLPSSLTELASHPWTPLSYMFTHISPLHLLFNMLWLYWFARLLHACSPRLLLTLYIGGGLAGAIGFLWVAVSSPIVGAASSMCGASAAIVALITAAAILSPDEHVRFFAVGAVRLRWVAFGALALTFFGNGLQSGSLAAHLGGLIFGALAALTVKYLNIPDVKQIRILPQRERKRSAEMFLSSVRKSNPRLSDPERLDELLDKIRLSGFSSLSSIEKNELNEISRRLREAEK
ncbi:MAG: rhomboid family intramembrane serine protease [Muribaculaceae bacterium]|nr:rhomboid family intramembrane serine protease [Muribaculaceae bacterium]